MFLLLVLSRRMIRAVAASARSTCSSSFFLFRRLRSGPSLHLLFRCQQSPEWPG